MADITKANEQIEEMARDIDVICDAFGRVNFHRTAELLIAKGYRKASEVASSVIGEILFYLDTHKQFDGFEFGKFLAELKKKYTGDGEG